MGRVQHRYFSVLQMVVNQVLVTSISPFEAEDDAPVAGQIDDEKTR